ncbi:type II toxin-antitoxin system HicA family toxin [Devosia aurantiaca]|uniref:Type II toxin-antitoxin system HicA family toxin n=1 Tax=Devosia aurantiaca TaxID=2714858 RepID=A0A6M1SNN7_9HYPH|nr:type II toxin-antitoxin system HicA family toxin [Devosia aurantiaca]NGP18294.1 type II toxin-antitoxin system HicA family toxin [Devosia aurantiaca]
MVKGFYAQIVDALKAAGCEFRRSGKGDHEIWYSPITNRTFSVDRGSLSRHTANAVMKQAGINKHF